MKIYKILTGFMFLVFNLSILSLEVNERSVFVGLDFPPEYQIVNIQKFLQKNIKSFKPITPFVKLIQITGNIDNTLIAQIQKKIKEAIEKFNLINKKSINNLKTEIGASLFNNQIVMQLANDKHLDDLKSLSDLIVTLLNNAQVNAIRLKPL